MSFKKEEEALNALKNTSALAQEQIGSFIEKTGAIQFVCEQHLTISELLDKYFNKQPPFSEKKKNEFPDAMVLIAVENWAKKITN